MNFLEAAVTSLETLLKSGFEIFGSREKAIDYAKQRSCAGQKAWDIALSNLGWEIK